MKKLISLILIGALFTGALVGCNKAEDPSNGGEVTTTGGDNKTPGTGEPAPTNETEPKKATEAGK
ncbi:MAG: hypothetical protein JNJ45_00285 [Chthonomonas sp.]|nr:hypothetical protein [Chthonomonas sp.]